VVGLSATVVCCVALLLSAPGALVLMLVPAALLSLAWPVGRLMWLVLGGMLVLQSGDGLNPVKFAYLAGVAVAGAVSLVRLPRHIRQPWAQPFRKVSLGGALLAALVLATACTGLVRGESLTDIARDALTYALILPGLAIGLDAAASLRLRTAERLVMGVAVLAAIGFTTAWISRRGVSAVDVDQFLLASSALMAVGVALAVTRGLSGRRIQWVWLAPLPLIISAPLVTGTRSGLLLVLGVFAVIRFRGRGRVAPMRLFAGLVIAAVAMIALLYFLGRRLTTGNFLEQRLVALQELFSGGLGADQSGTIRLYAFRIATDEWQSSPLFGRGFGHVYPNPNDPMLAGTFQMDTPLLLLAKFGLLGAALLFGGLVLVLSPMWTTTRLVGERLPEQSVIRGFVATMLGLLMVISPTEDKGFALTLPLLLVLVGCALRERIGTVEERTTRQRSREARTRTPAAGSRTPKIVAAGGPAEASRGEQSPAGGRGSPALADAVRQRSQTRGHHARTKARSTPGGLLLGTPRVRRVGVPGRPQSGRPLSAPGLVRGPAPAPPRPAHGESEPAADRS
jgi:hypothetical protein